MSTGDKESLFFSGDNSTLSVTVDYIRKYSDTESVVVFSGDELNAELEKDYLELSDFEVEVEHDGMTGLARALAEEFDLFILDLST